MMHLKPALSAAVVCALAGPALAELPPSAYAQARDGARSVLVLDVTEVRRLAPIRSSGACVVVGVVESVERGSAVPGTPVVVEVPCISDRYQHRPGPFPGYPQDDLAEAERVRVFMTAGRLVRRGLDILAP